MDSKKLFFICFTVLVCTTVAISFVRYVAQHDFAIVVEAACDHTLETCFARACDPEFDECAEGEENVYFKRFEQDGALYEFCDPANEFCKNLCESDSTPGCTEILCTETELGEGEFCSTYL